MKIRRNLILLFVVVLLIFAGCSKGGMVSNKTDESKVIEKQDFILDTIVTIKLYDFEDEKLLDEALELCRKYEYLLSSYKEGSLIYNLNKEGKGKLPKEGIECIKEGIRYGELSNHRFDISIFPISSLWDFTSGSTNIPDMKLIEEKLKKVDYTKININDDEVELKEGMAIDLGGIAKGYIADRLKDFLISRGVKSGIINLGGNNLCIGNKPSGESFKIGIQRPFAERNEIIATIDIKDMSIVTSGIYERSFEKNGILYHHILDTKTGFPVENNLESLTIISPKSVDGDGLSTSCFLLGIEEGKKLVESQKDCYAIFITKDNEIIYTEGLKEKFNLQLQ